MEQKKTPHSSPPPQPPIRGENPSRRINLSASTPLQASHPAPKRNLWASEPSLRFPLPQGNQDLADWLSSSNPNMMHPEQPEDAGMAESTYEIISAANADTDAEEQDDHDVGSMSESIGSLDFHRPDDVQSLAGTERSDDDSAPGDDDSYQDETPYEDDDDDDDEDEDDDDDDDDDGNSNGHGNDEDGMHEATIIDLQTSDAAVESLSDSDHEARSRCSLEYTQQSLGTPSLPTPEGSRLMERLPEPELEEMQKDWTLILDRLYEVKGHVRDFFVEAVSATLPGLMFVLTFALVLQLLHTPKQTPTAVPQASPTVAIMTTTTTFTTTATATATSTATTTATAIQLVTSESAPPSPTSAGAVDLIPVGEVVSDEWLFGANKPAISFTAQSQHDVLIHIPPKIKRTWQAKKCLTLTAKRDDIFVNTTLSTVDEGIVVGFHKKEGYGVITLRLEATCRPKVHKVVKVHFGKGLMEGALEMTKSLAQDLSKLMPATAQEAERRLVDAGRSLGSVCQNVCHNVQSASEMWAKTLGETRHNLEGMAAEAVGHVKAAKEQVAEQLGKVQDLSGVLQLYLLDAQISANLWWLQTTGRREEGEEYRRRAERLVAEKQAAVRGEGGKKVDEGPLQTVPWWSRRRA